jgi:DNA modification methylase
VLGHAMGSGTAGLAAQNLGRGFIGFEIDPDHHEITCQRLLAAAAA